MRTDDDDGCYPKEKWWILGLISFCLSTILFDGSNSFFHSSISFHFFQYHLVQCAMNLDSARYSLPSRWKKLVDISVCISLHHSHRRCHPQAWVSHDHLHLTHSRVSRYLQKSKNWWMTLLTNPTGVWAA